MMRAICAVAGVLGLVWLSSPAVRAQEDKPIRLTDRQVRSMSLGQVEDYYLKNSKSGRASFWAFARVEECWKDFNKRRVKTLYPSNARLFRRLDKAMRAWYMACLQLGWD